MIGTSRAIELERARHRGPLVTWTTLTITAAWPGHLYASGGGVDHAAVLADPAQAGVAVSPWPIVLVAIRPKAAAVAKQVERAAEEVGNEIGVAVRLLVDRLEPVEIALALTADIVFLPANGGLPTNASNRRILAVEHLGKLDLPVKRNDRVTARLRSCADGRLERAVRVTSNWLRWWRDRPRATRAAPSACVVVAREEGRDHEIAIAPDRVDKPVGGLRAARGASARTCRRGLRGSGGAVPVPGSSCPSMAARAKSRCFSGFQWNARIWPSSARPANRRTCRA